MNDILILILLRVIASHFFTQNIFLTGNGTIKLGDFGSARILSRWGNTKVAILGFCRCLSDFVANVLQPEGLRSDLRGDSLLRGSGNLGKQALQQ